MGIVKFDNKRILFQTWNSKDPDQKQVQNPEVKFCFYPKGIQIRFGDKAFPREDSASKQMGLRELSQ